jgi:hypothetical protein
VSQSSYAGGRAATGLNSSAPAILVPWVRVRVNGLKISVGRSEVGGYSIDMTGVCLVDLYSAAIDQPAADGALEDVPLTDEVKKNAAVAAAKHAMQLAMHGIVKSSAAMDQGPNGWWKGSTLKQKDKGGDPDAAAAEQHNVPKGDWLCQSYNCSKDGKQYVNFKKNTKCMQCGAAKRADTGRG